MNFENRTIVVTGGTGFLGKHVCRKLFSLYGDSIKLFPLGSRNYNLVSYEDTKRMYQDLRPDIVIHLAGKVGGIEANRKNPGLFFYDNLMLGANIIEHGRINKIEKLVFIGTGCSYPRDIEVPFKEEDMWNGFPEITNSPYGVAKRALLIQCQAYREQYGLNAIYLIPANLYGPHDNFDVESGHVVPGLINKFLNAHVNNIKKVDCWGTGKATREFLYVEDAATAICMALEKYNGSSPINIGSGHEISIFDLVNMISDIVGYKEKIVWDSSRPDGQPKRSLEISKAKKEFGFEAQISLEEGLVETIKWYRENK